MKKINMKVKITGKKIHTEIIWFQISSGSNRFDQLYLQQNLYKKNIHKSLYEVIKTIVTRTMRMTEINLFVYLQLEK